MENLDTFLIIPVYTPCTARISDVSLEHAERFREFNLHKEDECINQSLENFWLAETGAAQVGFTMDFCRAGLMTGVRIRNIAQGDGSNR